MADNVDVTPGSGATVAADEVTDGTLGSVKVQYVKLMDGTLDGTSKALVDSSGLKVNLGADNDVTITSGTVTTITNVVHVDDNSSTLSVDDGAGSLTVDYATTGSGTATGALRVELPTNGTGVVGLNAGSNIIGKTGIDQTTPGTTNLVALTAETTKVIGTVRTASGGIASGSIASGAVASGAYASGALASGSIASGAMVDLVAEQTPITPTTATATKGLLIGGQYNSTQATFTNTQQGALQISSRGEIKSNLMDAAGNARGVNVNASNQALVYATIDSTQLGSLGQAAKSASAPVVPASDWVYGTGYHVAVAASQTDSVIQSSTGATGDYLDHVIVVPATTAPGVVTIKDNTTAIVSYPGGGTTALLTLTPFVIPVGAVSRSGAWKITTGANVSVVAVGKFS